MTWVNQTSKPSLNKQTYITQLTIEFMAKTFDTETAFLDTVVNRGTRFKEKSILDAKTHFKQTEAISCTHISPRVTLQMLKKDLLKKPWESYEKTPQKQPLRKIIQGLMDGGYPQSYRKPTIRSKIHKRESKLLKQNNKEEKEILPFLTKYQPSVSTIKEAWMKKWNLIQNQL